MTEDELSQEYLKEKLSGTLQKYCLMSGSCIKGVTTHYDPPKRMRLAGLYTGTPLDETLEEYKARKQQ